ncbi:SpvB/TcaC N-terminal domain-containing protein [Streptomyces sp. TX20-6-3]|uniref:SpvB/TcaC N-terminal domain-containing protein n=1 Tax=Streptomyces sp. TX20-6-3 TaxID=3028705 RepID=UPI0029BEC566|nr:SpvB/TcaC N-terminal domain-containing protein [Streptomyces sp. TX20-6-3]MDX2564918.1 SpvB/TcaC N-terminal domain-containing protein [Streptomyces sp. TX20-6-3]
MTVQLVVRRRTGVTILLAMVLTMSGLTSPELLRSAAASVPDAGAAVNGPEGPEGTSFNPNQIKDIKAADPGSGVNLVEAPSANNTGDARLSYPLEVPKGRAGLEPGLAVTYNSSGTSGWLGVGWDLATPMVTVDTRWGVPRYDAGLETETYLLNGEQLTPVAHRSALRARTAEKVFHTRVEGRFDRIVRHGDSPTNYWWEVTDKQGVRTLFGGTADSTLADGTGRVATWAARETRDGNDNVLRYRYAKVADGGTAGSTVPGSDLYPRKITYTGRGDTDGRYSVTFIRDRERGEPRRPDVRIDATYGFKKVTADLLRRVEVKLDDQLIRAYELNYRTGAFAKTLLTSVSQFSESNQLFHTHTFDYFDDVRDPSGTYNTFADAAGWSVPDDDLGVNIREGEASAISANTSVGFGAHLFAGYNVQGLPTKEGAVGLKVGFNAGQSDGLSTLTDVNGDNLPDKVFRRNKDVFYRPNLATPGGAPKFGDTPIKLTGLPGISTERTLSGTIGVESYVLTTSAQLDFVGTTTTSDRFFADVNGDGIADLVNNGGVLFGYLDANGQPAYSADSTRTPVPIGGGAVTGEIVGDQTAQFNQQVDNSPLLDTVRRWVAPYDGTVRVDGRVQLTQDPSPARAASTKADGVRVTIQHKDTELWAQRIGPDDHTEFTPGNVASIPVRKGDALYFRTQSILDGTYDTVAWDPAITYTDLPAGTDANGLADTVFRASADFTFGGRPSLVTVPVNGTLRLTGDVVKNKATSDDVTVVIEKGNGVHPGAEVFRKVLPAASTGIAAIDVSIPVRTFEKMSWKLKTDSPIDASAVTWAPKAHYTAAQGVESVVDAAGDPTLVITPPYDQDMFPANTLTAPQQSYKATRTGQLKVRPKVSLNFNLLGDAKIALTVKKRGGQLLGKRVFQAKDTSPFGGPNLDLTVPVTAGDDLYIDYSTTETGLLGLLVSQSASVTYDVTSAWPTFTPAPSAMHASVGQGAFAQPYRGWGVIGYQGNRDRATQPLKQAELTLDQSFRNALPKEPKEADVAPFAANPRLTMPRLAVFAPVPAKGGWAAQDESSWITAAMATSSRLGADTIDIVTDADVAGDRAVMRRGVTGQVSATLAAGPFGGTVVGGITAGSVDYLDLNGDGYPDVVGAKEIQFSDMTGALGATRGTLGGNVREADNVSGNVSLSAGSETATIASALGMAAPDAGTSANTATTGAVQPSLGIGGSLGGGESDVRVDLIDINGDGLPDKVFGNGDVQLNLGYSFAAREPWSAGPINDASTRNVGVNLGFNVDRYGFAGGVSAELGTSFTHASMTDVNGDGLTDRVFTDGANPIKVAVNTGTGFTAPTPFRGSFPDIAVDKNASLGGGVYFTVGLPTPVGVFVFNPGVNASTGISRAETSLRDVNGDGLADHVKSTRDDELLVAVNKTGRTNLLRSVSRPMGARIDLDYTRSGNTADMQESRWALTRTSVFDGLAGDGADTRRTTFRYERGRYDRLEREFLGFGRVVTEDRDTGTDGAVRRTVTDEYRTDGYVSRGLLTRTLTEDGAGHPYRETLNTYRLLDTSTDQEADPKSRTATVFPQLTRVEDKYYEGAAAAGKSTSTDLSYDEYGNVTRTVDKGDEGAADDLETTYGYSGSDTRCRDRYLVGIADALWQKAAATGALLRHRASTVDCATGAVGQIREYLDDDTAAVSDLTYHPDGNLRSVTGPANAKGQRYTLEYGYDTTVGVHIESIEDSFGYRSSTAYNLKYGRPERNTDHNGQPLRMSYDSVGRLDKVTGPYEKDGDRATITFGYHPEAAVPYATTAHLDRAASGVRDDTIDTVTFTDGLKRVLQTKKDASVSASPGAEPTQVMTVSGRLTFDHLGRAVEKYYPVTEEKGAANTTFNASFDSVAPTRDTFDVLDRSVRTVQPDGVTTSTRYGFGQDRDGATRFERTATDGNGKERRTYTDVRGATTSVKEFNGSSAIWTSYTYDPSGQVTTITDDQNNVTRAGYDALGRRVSFDSPDAGRSETRYDLAGNVTSKITANLRAAGEAVEYDYEYSRLKAIRYPTFPDNDVSYEYGAPGAPDNAASRVTEVHDAAGTVKRAYGALGEVIKETRTITAVRDAPRTYTTAWRYDAYNRVLQMTYPDGEVLTYDYDSGGQVGRATGSKNGTGYTYLDRVDYDKFGQKILQQTGNGVRTTYTYDAEDRRLGALASVAPGGTAFQNLGYAYDRIGNITSLANDAPQGGDIGGPSSQTYGYDDQYRLTSASGRYTDKNNAVHTYTLSLGHDSIHNTTSKSQTHEVTGGTAAFPVGGGGAGPIEPVEDPSNPSDVQDRTTYDYTYAYDGARPHAPTEVGPISHAYDANGNLTGTVNTAATDKRRQYVWDEENRLVCNQDTATGALRQGPGGCAGATVAYVYDDKGDRLVKRSEDGLSLYPNRYYSERDATGYKHVFVGDSRVTTKAVATTGPEDAQQFFHADHIGSSGYVTDKQGKVTEHLEYFPYGETWVEERTGQADTPYQFTGKELDVETGLYYYGARYYNPRTQLWASTDPALPDYLDGDMAGGIAEPRNLAVYTYAHNNPVKLMDPTGKWPKMPSWKTIGHTTLDVVGMVPVVGEVGDLANAGWYAAEGDYVNAGLSAASAIPGAGYAANAAKYGNKALDAAQAAKTAGNAGDAAATAKAADTAPVPKAADSPAAPKPADSGPAPKAADTGGGGCGTGNSFTPDTRVVMADGTHKPIGRVRIGDTVTATDPVTGETGPRTVTALITGEGEKNLVEITVTAPGGQPGKVVATDNHPFWAPEPGKWLYAKEIVPGMLLQTGNGSYTQVSAVRAWSQHKRVHNLTIDDLHTYYVLAGETAVLVHNATPGQKCDLTLGAGPNAREGVGLENGDIEADGVRDLINESGNKYGCHTCDATTPGTKDGDWIPDHQPPSSLVAPGSPQTAYPHCLPCARRQGGVVSQLSQGKSQKEW